MNIFSACKCGDLSRVIYLVEVQGVSLQQRDAWDATPLYYASFVGNTAVIKYLLSKGATCEENTFDGERCLYAALNDSTRNLLLDKGFKFAGARRHDLYLEFLEKLFDNSHAFPDIAFALSGMTIQAHRFMLAARCPMLGKLLGKRWRGQNLVTNLGRLDAAALEALIRWCYTWRLEVPVSASASCQQLLRAMKLPHLADALAVITGNDSTIAVIEPARDLAKMDLQTAMDQTAGLCCSPGSQGAEYLYPDIVLRTEAAEFRAHRAMLCGRSEYFAVMLTNTNFLEGQPSHSPAGDRRDYGNADNLKEVQLKDVHPQILRTSLLWIYTDKVDASLPAEHLLEVMRFADRLMCEGLKQRCAVHLQPHVTQATTLFFLCEAVRMDVPRLADVCLRVAAQHLVSLVKEPQFAELVRESAASVENREDVDSVPIVDDLRYHIAQLFGDGELSEDEEADWDEDGNLVFSGIEQDFELLSKRKQKLYVLQELLQDLGIEA